MTSGAGACHFASPWAHISGFDWDTGGGWGQSPEMMLLSWQLAVSIDFSPFTKISTRPSFAEACLGHKNPLSHCVGPPFLFLHSVGLWRPPAP